MLRVPSSSALATAATALPPAPSTPTSANCDAPVNSSSDSTQACSVDSPAVTAAAPNDSPYAPTATPMPAASRRTRPALAQREAPAGDQLADQGAELVDLVGPSAG